LDKSEAADLIRDKLPTKKAIRSGDLGEIYATEWIDAHSDYRAPIKRLRWKDHRNMAMRGEDVIGIRQDAQSQRLHFLKTEAKSRANLTKQVLADARIALNKDDDRPSAHALSFISEQLLNLGSPNDLKLADAIDAALRKRGILAQDVRHLLFTFSGNPPDALLTAALHEYPGAIKQWCVGLHVDNHANFIVSVYDRVIADAEST
jgi:hypothetical protein